MTYLLKVNKAIVTRCKSVAINDIAIIAITATGPICLMITQCIDILE